MGFNWPSLIPFLLASAFAIGVIIKYSDRLYGFQKPVLPGQAVLISSPRVTSVKGEAWYQDEGLTIILQVRSRPGARPLFKGDRAVIARHDQSQNTYTVIAETNSKVYKPF